MLRQRPNLAPGGVLSTKLSFPTDHENRKTTDKSKCWLSCILFYKDVYKFSPLFSLLFFSRLCRLGRIIALNLPSWSRLALQLPHKLVSLSHLAGLPALGQ